MGFNIKSDVSTKNNKNVKFTFFFRKEFMSVKRNGESTLRRQYDLIKMHLSHKLNKLAWF